MNVESAAEEVFWTHLTLEYKPPQLIKYECSRVDYVYLCVNYAYIRIFSLGTHRFQHLRNRPVPGSTRNFGTGSFHTGTVRVPVPIRLVPIKIAITLNFVYK